MLSGQFIHQFQIAAAIQRSISLTHRKHQQLHLSKVIEWVQLTKNKNIN